MNEINVNHESPFILGSNNSLKNDKSNLYTKKLGKKRNYKEIENNSFSDEYFEKRFSNLTITKKFKLNSNDKYLLIEHHIQVDHFIEKSKNEDKLYYDNQQVNLSNLRNFDIENEKKMVQAFYSQKNRLLSDLMFGSQN